MGIITMRAFLAALAIAFAAGAAAADTAIPDRHPAIARDTDYPGGDIASLFDTNLDSCQAACMADTACIAFTYNQRASSCFLKADIGTATPFVGAISGMMISAAPTLILQGETRAVELSFLDPLDLSAARDLALAIGRYHSSDGFSAFDLVRAATQAEATGDLIGALSFTGAALAVADQADLWDSYARLGAVATDALGNEPADVRARVIPALVNAYLRAPDDGARVATLARLADALEANGRGALAIPALRLSLDIAPDRATETALDRVIGLFGFRVVDTQVDSDAAAPRICATFSEPLVQAGVDYAPFVQLPDSALTVSVQDAQLCIDGVEHGQRYRVVLRPGLPAASGEEMVRPAELTLYVRDRAPGVRFVSRAYVLPRAGDVAIPVETVNLDEVALTLQRFSDRNIIRSMQDGYFGFPMAEWTQEYFDDSIGQTIWTGTAAVAQDLNRDVTTRIPLGTALRDQPPGVYVLSAVVPGADENVNPGASQWFILSDLGLATMLGNDGLTVALRSLTDASALPGAQVTLLSRSNDVLGTTLSDADGVARFAPGLVRGTGSAEPALVTAVLGDDLAFLSLTDPAFDLSDRGVTGREPAGPIDVFLTPDRGAYRAGETIHLTALMRDDGVRAVTGVPLTAVLSRPDGVEYSRIASVADSAGGHVFALPVAGSAPRGTWTIAVLADVDAPPLATTQVLVEDFLPERIDVALDLPALARLADGVLPTGVTATYLFGPPGADLGIEGEVLLTAATSLPGWPGYQFGQYDQPFDARLESLPQGTRTGADGSAVVQAALPQADGATQPLTARVTVRVTEGSGRPVERRAETLVLPASDMIGIKPLFDGVVPEGGQAQFQVVALTPDLTPAPMALRYTVNRVDTWYQWYQLYGNWNWEPTTTRTRVSTGDITFDGTPVTIDVPVDWGQYEIVVERTGAEYAAASVSFEAGWYAVAGADPTPDLLESSLDATSYAIGDTANYRIVPRYAGIAVISVLTDRVVAMQAVPVVAGENLIPLPVTADWGTGAYVTASVIRPMDVAADQNPARALGLAHAQVQPGDRALSVILSAPLQAAPRGPLVVDIDVQGAIPGAPAFVTLAAVDVGILNLTGFDAPDPQGYYFGQRKLGVELRDIYGRLIDGMTGAMGSVRTGGDGGGGMTLQSPPPTEELVAYFTGPVQVGADGKAQVTFDLPSFNGTVRLMAVAWSAQGVGQAQLDVLVRDPVVVTASLPRFLAPGDQSRLLLEIVHAEGLAGTMALSVTADGLKFGNVPASVTIADQGRAVLRLPFTAGDAGLHQVQVTLTTPDGTVLTKDLTVPVQVNDPAVVRSLRLSLAPGQTFTFDDAVFADMVPGTGIGTLSVGPLARLDAAGLLTVLDRYPYGCSEQIASAAMPLLYLDDVATAMGLATRDEVALRIDQAIRDVLANQSSNGAFGLWGPWSGDLWLDAYVTDFLSRARARGYQVPDIAWTTALDNLRNRVNYYPEFESGGEDIAYALMILAREGAAAVGDLRYYADERAFAFSTPLGLAQLGAALAYYGDQARADGMFAKAQAMLTGQRGTLDETLWRVDYGSYRRDAAALLALGVEAGSTAVDRDGLTADLAGAGQEVSTQEAAWTLLAANALLTDLSGAGVTVNGAVPDGPVVQVRADQAAVAPLVIANTGTGPTDITVTVLGVPTAPEKAGGNGWSITRDYYTLEGEPVTLDSVAAGARLVTVLTVAPLGDRAGRLMVNDPLPAGFEIDNPNLLRGGDLSGLDWLNPVEATHAEFRQERFLAAVDHYGPDPFQLAYIVRAVSPGTFHHPAASVEDMYRPQFRARTGAGQVTVSE